MIRRLIASLALAAALIAPLALGSADPAEAKPGWKGGGRHHGWGGGPPPWAPARGFRRKHGSGGYGYRGGYGGRYVRGRPGYSRW